MIAEIDESNNIKVIQWACGYLSSNGYTLKNNLPEEIQNTPWSYVVRFSTSAGYIYLKHTPKLLALEPIILQILRNQLHASVPEVIGQNAELSCFLMKDAGRSLRTILKKQFDATLLCRAVDQFTTTQLSVADHIDVFLDIGVPDWRLNRLPDLYMQLLKQKDLLIEDGLLEQEINQLEMLLPTVIHLCGELSAYSVKQSLVQPDFNDNNSLIDDKSQNITIIDLGEIVISHPFFSLLNCLQQINKHYGLTDLDNDYLKIQEACLKNYISFESRENLLTVFKLARPLWFVYDALAGERLINACGKSKILAYQHGKLIGSLRDFMAACNSTDL